MRSHHGVIALAPLDRSQVRHMVGELATRHALPKEVIDGVTERTGGVPLFVEEVTRLLLERGEHAGIQAIPPTLQQSLTARLDRLGPAREIAQIGAVIGRDFSYPLLRVVAGTEDAPLQMALERLAEADILLVQGVPPESGYRFKHVLIQDAAYENLLKSRRQALHRRVGEVLRDQFAASTAAEPELLAHHFSQAGLPEVAIEWWGKAAQRSLERSALVEAIGQFTRALDQIASLPATLELRREQIKLQVALITPLIHVKGYAAPETRAAIERARLLIEQAQALGESPEDPLILFSTLFGFLVINIVAFNGDVMPQLAAEFLAFAEKQGTTPFLVTAHRIVGACLLYLGDIVGSLPHFERTIELYDPAEHRSLAMGFGQDAELHALCYRSWAFWFLGYPKAALVDAHHAVHGAREISQAGTLMTILALTIFTYVFCGDDAAATAQLDELAGLAENKGALYWRAFTLWMQGWLLTLAGKAPEAVHKLTSGITAWRSTGAALYAPTQLSYLATAYAKLGQFDDARRSINIEGNMV
jgi:tetratricopeptide (TPR) repeat protein